MTNLQNDSTDNLSRPERNYVCRKCLLSGNPSNKIIVVGDKKHKHPKCAICGNTKLFKGCPECGSPNIKYEEDMEEVVCHHCGLVLMSAPPDYVDTTHLDFPWGVLLHRMLI